MVSHLFSRGKLNIPGVGILRVKRIAAKKRLHEAKLYGPALLVDFKEDTSLEESSFIEVLVKKYDWSQSEASQKISDLGGKIINDVLNFGEAQILHLGRFRKQQNEAFTFEVDPMLQKSFQITYPDLPLQLVPDKKKQELNKKLREEYYLGPHYEKKDKVGWFFPLLALLATSLLLACLITCFIQRDQKISFSPIIKKAENQNTIPLSEPGPPASVTMDSVQNEAQQDQAVDSQNGVDPLFEDEILTQDNRMDKPIDSSQWLDEDQREEGASFGNFEGIENLSLDRLLQESAAKRLSYNKACMIVVGSYMRRDLIDKMVRKLQEENYEIYIEKYGGFYRTAIIYECDEVNTSTFLQKVRREIEKKAWILEY